MTLMPGTDLMFAQGGAIGIDVIDAKTLKPTFRLRSRAPYAQHESRRADRPYRAVGAHCERHARSQALSRRGRSGNGQIQRRSARPPRPPYPGAGRQLLGKTYRLRVTASARQHRSLRDDPARLSAHERKRVLIPVWINPDDVVDLICKHLV